MSYLVPVLNEAARLAGAVHAALEQEYDGEQEVVVAVAPSTDGTEEVAAGLARVDPRVRVVENPATDIPAALNRALAASSGEFVVRVDAHSELPAGYTRRMVEVLLETGAANAGGIMRAEGRTPLQESVARAYNSGLGLGGGVHHAGSAAGPAETAYLGVFRRTALLAVGGYDETLRRGEDYDLNVRLRDEGYDVWFVPDVEVTYWPRDAWTPLVRQMWATGVWRGEMVRRRRRTRVRYLAAPAVVVGTRRQCRRGAHRGRPSAPAPVRPRAPGSRRLRRLPRVRERHLRRHGPPRTGPGRRRRRDHPDDVGGRLPQGGHPGGGPHRGPFPAAPGARAPAPPPSSLTPRPGTPVVTDAGVPPPRGGGAPPALTRARRRAG